MRTFCTGALFWLFVSTLSFGTLQETEIDKTKPYLKIDLVYNYDVYKRPVFFAGKSKPTFSIWVKDITSGNKETLYVTYKAGREKWKFTKHRPESIPVWYGINRAEKESGSFDIDAVTAATPKGERATIFWQIPDRYMGKPLKIFIEANNSFDFNTSYHKKKKEEGYSGSNGQPSVVFQADLNLKSLIKGSRIQPTLIGHGDLFGKAPGIQNDTSKITTAAMTFKTMTIHYIVP